MWLRKNACTNITLRSREPHPADRYSCSHLWLVPHFKLPGLFLFFLHLAGTSIAVFAFAFFLHLLHLLRGFPCSFQTLLVHSLHLSSLFVHNDTSILDCLSWYLCLGFRSLAFTFTSQLDPRPMNDSCPCSYQSTNKHTRYRSHSPNKCARNSPKSHSHRRSNACSACGSLEST